jgi:hypothetical protein
MKSNAIVLIIALVAITFIIGCSNTQNILLADSTFCFTNTAITGSSPFSFAGDGNSRFSFRVQMPVEPGTYRIMVTTSMPQSAVDIKVSYNKVINRDKFGNPLFRYEEVELGTVDRFKDMDKQFTVPDGSTGGLLKVFRNIYSSSGDDCGSIKVYKL